MTTPVSMRMVFVIDGGATVGKHAHLTVAMRLQKSISEVSTAAMTSLSATPETNT